MNTNLIVDPTDHFLDHTESVFEINKGKENIILACGFLPDWAINPDYEEHSLQDALDLQYGFGLFEMKGGTIEENGTYKYPEDPILYPLIKIIRGEETLYQYSYGIVAIVQVDGSSFVTRMD